VAVDLDIYRGMVHGFINWDRAVPEAKQCHQDAGRALRNAFSNCPKLLDHYSPT